MLKELTVQDIRNWGPCHDPVEKGYCKEDWKGTILDILNKRSVSIQDRIWCALKYLDDRECRLFAVWCARRALSTIKSPDPRSIEAVDVAERFANGQDEKLSTVYAAARDAYIAAYDAARAADDAVAYAAARDARAARASYVSVHTVAYIAADTAADAAATAVSYAAVYDVARDAAVYDADVYTAADTAYVVERKAQLAYLRKVCKRGGG